MGNLANGMGGIAWTQRIGLISDGHNGHRSELDGWRGMAILLVLVSHFFNTIYVFDFNAGRLGVHTFFVLSGVLMGHILFVKRTDLRCFYQRRFSRVFPLFWLYLAVIYGTGYVIGATETGNVLYTATFTRSHMGDSIWGTDLPIGHLWSLNIEEHAYLIMSGLTLLFLRPAIAAIGLFLLGTFSLLLHYLMVTSFEDVAGSHMRIQTELNLAWIFLPAAYSMVKHHTARFVKPWMVWGALLLAAACYHNDAPWYAEVIVSPWCLAFAVNHLKEAGRAMLSVLNMTALRIIGLWSFSIYIWQQPLYFWWVQPKGYPLVEASVGLLLSIGLGALSFYAFENPIRHAINARWAKRNAIKNA